VVPPGEPGTGKPEIQRLRCYLTAEKRCRNGKPFVVEARGMARHIIRAGLWAERHAAPLFLAMLGLILCAIFAAKAPAQTVRLSNFSGVPFDGWKRTTVDVLPPLNSGRVGETLFVVGRRVGLATWVVDLRCSLAAGEQRSVDLATGEASTWSREPLPDDPLQWFGGVASIGGELLAPIALQADGAGYTAQLRARVARMFAVDLWVTWYADRPGWAHGECIITASNPSVPDLDATVPLLDLPPTLAAGSRGVERDPMNPLFREVGRNHLKSRLRSHPDVAQKHHADLL
jgi:hypothetical protein